MFIRIIMWKAKLIQMIIMQIPEISLIQYKKNEDHFSLIQLSEVTVRCEFLPRALARINFISSTINQFRFFFLYFTTFISSRKDNSIRFNQNEINVIRLPSISFINYLIPAKSSSKSLHHLPVSLQCQSFQQAWRGHLSKAYRQMYCGPAQHHLHKRCLARIFQFRLGFRTSGTRVSHGREPRLAIAL